MHHNFSSSKQCVHYDDVTRACLHVSRSFGIFAEFIRDVILGLVAGLMITTIAMSLAKVMMMMMKMLMSCNHHRF